MCGSYIIVVMLKFRVNWTFDLDEQVKEHIYGFGVSKRSCIFPVGIISKICILNFSFFKE